jgi:hypothetical protein
MKREIPVHVLIKLLLKNHFHNKTLLQLEDREWRQLIAHLLSARERAQIVNDYGLAMTHIEVMRYLESVRVMLIRQNPSIHLPAWDRILSFQPKLQPTDTGRGDSVLYSFASERFDSHRNQRFDELVFRTLKLMAENRSLGAISELFWEYTENVYLKDGLLDMLSSLVNTEGIDEIEPASVVPTWMINHFSASAINYQLFYKEHRKSLQQEWLLETAASEARDPEELRIYLTGDPAGSQLTKEYDPFWKEYYVSQDPEFWVQTMFGFHVRLSLIRELLERMETDSAADFLLEKQFLFTRYAAEHVVSYMRSVPEFWSLDERRTLLMMM